MKIDLSELPGFSTRAYAGPPDHAAMTAMTNRWYEAVGLDERVSVARIDSSYKNLDPERCDTSTDMLMVDGLDGRLAGYIRLEWWPVTDEPTRYAVVPHIDPDHRDTQLSRRLIEAGVDRSIEIAGGHTAPPAGRVLEGWSSQQREPDLGRQFEDLGFEVITYAASMSRSLLGDLPHAELPPGLEIRPVDEDQLRKIWEADEAAFQDHFGWSEPTEHDYQAFLDFPNRDTSLWRVAWDGDEVAGQVKSYIDAEENATLKRRRGYTEFISTGRDWRKRGVARALICASFQALVDRGMTEASLGVHTENPTGAFGLYESLGFAVNHTFLTWHKTIE